MEKSKEFRRFFAKLIKKLDLPKILLFFTFFEEISEVYDYETKK
jgi:hypothetical protein